MRIDMLARANGNCRDRSNSFCADRGKTASPSTAWKQPKTPWGDPDLQVEPIEHDRKLGTRAVLNDEEYAK